MHGFAFNVNTDLNLFNGIIPCGIQAKSVTSLSKEINRIINIQEVKEKLLTNFKEVFGYSNILSVQEEDLFQTKIVNT